MTAKESRESECYTIQIAPYYHTVVHEGIDVHTVQVNILSHPTIPQVGDGQAALDSLASGRFDLLVLDLGLPKKAGMEVLTELRAMPLQSMIRDTPVIVSSGHVLDEHRRLCLEAG